MVDELSLRIGLCESIANTRTTHGSLACDAGHVDDGPLGLDEVGHAELGQMVHRPEPREQRHHHMDRSFTTRAENITRTTVLRCHAWFVNSRRRKVGMGKASFSHLTIIIQMYYYNYRYI